MNDRIDEGRLTANEPPPSTKINPEGKSPFVLVGDHAGNRVPSRLASLGLGTADLQRHIAWDIGVGALGTGLAAALDAVFIRQVYSRLVIDCNRTTAASDCIAEISDGTPVPGNQQLDNVARAARIAEIYDPYHHAIESELIRRDALGLETILVALHSFTPRMNGFDRPWHVGILHDGGDTAYAQAVLRAFGTGPHVIGDNEPYRMDDTDYTIPRHAYAAGRRYVELEVRQDLLGKAAQVAEMTALIATNLRAAARERGATTPGRLTPR